jgi:hypothetical protein
VELPTRLKRSLFCTTQGKRLIGGSPARSTASCVRVVASVAVLTRGGMRSIGLVQSCAVDGRVDTERYCVVSIDSMYRGLLMMRRQIQQQRWKNAWTRHIWERVGGAWSPAMCVACSQHYDTRIPGRYYRMQRAGRAVFT